MKKNKIGLYIINANYKQYIPWCLRSVEKLSIKPDVLVMIDDCSTDGSMEMVKEHFNYIKFDRVIVNLNNLGTVKTINLIVDILGNEFKCDYICGLSADDMFHPDYIKETKELLDNSDEITGWIYTHVRRIGDENSIDIHPEWSQELHEKIPFCHGSSLIKFIAWQSVGGLPDLEKEEDWLMFRNMAKLGWKGRLLPKPLLYWRKHRDYARTFFKNESYKLRGGKK